MYWCAAALVDPEINDIFGKSGSHTAQNSSKEGPGTGPGSMTFGGKPHAVHTYSPHVTMLHMFAALLGVIPVLSSRVLGYRFAQQKAFGAC